MTQSTTEFVETKEKASKRLLEDVYQQNIGDGETIQVCSGEWRPSKDNPNTYIFYKDPDWEA